MRVGLVIYGSLETLTGGFLYDKFLVAHLRRQGHSVDILALPWRRYGRHLLDNLSSKLRSAFAAEAYDLILQDELNHPSLFLLNRRLKKQTRAPLVAVVHQVLCCQPRPWLVNRFYRAVEKSYLASVDAFIFNSGTTCANVRDLLDGNPAARASIVANPGADRLGRIEEMEAIKARVFAKGPLKLVFVGNLTPVKGLVPLVESLALMPPETWRLTVVGDITMDRAHVRKVRQLIAARGLSQQVTLAGPLNGGHLKRVLSGSQLFAMPFANEGFGIACLEALAHALPVLGSTAGAVKEYIQHGRNGVLIAPDDPRTLGALIAELYADRKKLFAMSLAALETHDRLPTWNDSMEAVHRFLENLASR